MTDNVKQAVIRRLWELCEGRIPKACGLCGEMMSLRGRRPTVSAYQIASKAVYELTGTSGYVFPIGDWGNDRRTLAGILACYLSDQP